MHDLVLVLITLYVLDISFYYANHTLVSYIKRMNLLRSLLQNSYILANLLISSLSHCFV